MVTWHKREKIGEKQVDGLVIPYEYRQGSCLSADTLPTGDPGIANGSSMIIMDGDPAYLRFYNEAAHEWTMG